MGCARVDSQWPNIARRSLTAAPSLLGVSHSLQSVFARAQQCLGAGAAHARRFFYSFAAVLGLLAGLVDAAGAAAWTQPAGQGLAIIKVDEYQSDRYWDRDRHSQDTATYRKFELNPYLEYGVTDRTTLGANVFVLHVEQEGSGNSTGLGDVELFGRYRLYSGGWDSLALQFLMKLPTGYDKNEAVALGAGQVDAEIRLLYGRGGTYGSGVHLRSWYYDVEAGLRKRYGEPTDELRLDWLAGWRPTPDWTLEIKQENILALARVSPPSGAAVSRWADYDLHKVTIGAIYQVSTHVAANVGVGYDIAGRNAGQGIAPYLAIWRRF